MRTSRTRISAWRSTAIRACSLVRLRPPRRADALGPPWSDPHARGGARDRLCHLDRGGRRLPPPGVDAGAVGAVELRGVDELRGPSVWILQSHTKRVRACQLTPSRRLYSAFVTSRMVSTFVNLRCGACRSPVPANPAWF